MNAPKKKKQEIQNSLDSHKFIKFDRLINKINNVGDVSIIVYVRINCGPDNVVHLICTHRKIDSILQNNLHIRMHKEAIGQCVVALEK